AGQRAPGAATCRRAGHLGESAVPVSRLRRLWARWCHVPAEAKPEPLPRPGVAPHEQWLDALIEKLRTPEAEGAFRRADTLSILNDPAADDPAAIPRRTGEPRPVTRTASHHLSAALTPGVYREADDSTWEERCDDAVMGPPVFGEACLRLGAESGRIGAE